MTITEKEMAVEMPVGSSAAETGEAYKTTAGAGKAKLMATGSWLADYQQKIAHSPAHSLDTVL